MNTLSTAKGFKQENTNQKKARLLQGDLAFSFQMRGLALSNRVIGLGGQCLNCYYLNCKY